jgi:hypothetical protein
MRHQTTYFEANPPNLGDEVHGTIPSVIGPSPPWRTVIEPSVQAG